jgi:ribonuclease R
MVELPAEGLVHVTSLADDYYYLEAGTHTLVGRRSGRRYRLGDRVEVRIARVDVDRRELDLVLAESTSPAGKNETIASGPRGPVPKAASEPKKDKFVKGRKPKGGRGRKR